MFKEKTVQIKETRDNGIETDGIKESENEEKHKRVQEKCWGEKTKREKEVEERKKIKSVVSKRSIAQKGNVEGSPLLELFVPFWSCLCTKKKKKKHFLLVSGEKQ